jgi:peptidoglycan/xylan/chitin deacetylase (PgdA/CDA1 family)
MYSGRFEWPNGAHIAVVFNIAWETWPDNLGTAASTQGGRRLPATAAYTRAMREIYEHAFAETGGMQRLLDMWKRYDIRGSCFVNGETLTKYPELARQIAAQGNELLAESWDHEFLWEMTEQQEAESIDRSIAAFKEVLGKPPAGFSTPGGNPTNATFRLVAGRGFKYMCGLRNAEVPFIIKQPGLNKIVGMISYSLSDTRTHRGDWTPRQTAHAFRDNFDALYAEGKRGYVKMLSYGSHPMLGHGFRTLPIEETIQHIKEQKNVWITTREQIADWVLKNYGDADLSYFYPDEAARQDRSYGLSTGLGGQEAIDRHNSYRKK